MIPLWALLYFEFGYLSDGVPIRTIPLSGFNLFQIISFNVV